MGRQKGIGKKATKNEIKVTEKWPKTRKRGERKLGTLVAPYRTIPQDYLSDTPLLRAMGFLVSQHGQLGAIPPPPFLSVSPWRACEVEVRYPPQKGYLSDTCVISYENMANGCDAPICDTISKGYCAIWGGISHWATKLGTRTPPLKWAFAFLGCRKWRFKRWGFKEIRGYPRKKAFFLRFLDFPGVLQALRKGMKKAEKGRKRPISADFREGRPDTP